MRQDDLSKKITMPVETSVSSARLTVMPMVLLLAVKYTLIHVLQHLKPPYMNMLIFGRLLFVRAILKNGAIL